MNSCMWLLSLHSSYVFLLQKTSSSWCCNLRLTLRYLIVLQEIFCWYEILERSLQNQSAQKKVRRHISPSFSMYLPDPCAAVMFPLLVLKFTSSFSVQIETAQRGALHPGRGRESCRYGLLHTSKNSWSENTASGRGHELAAHFNSGLINWTLLKPGRSTSGCRHNQKALPFYILGNLMYNMYSTYVNIESMYRTVCNLTKF